MDLAVFIGELLGQQGTLSVPGLGKFTRVHKDSYYDDDRSIFYPPHFETRFEEEESDDPALAQYISSTKGISFNSADYFIDKYVGSLKQQARREEVQMDELGWITFQGSTLNFKPNSAPATYEKEYFGFPPISISKIWEQLSGHSRKPQPVFANTFTATAIPEPAPLKTISTATPPNTTLPPPPKPAAPAPLKPEAPAPKHIETATPPPVEPATPELAIFPEVLTLKNETTAQANAQVQNAKPLKDDNAVKPPINIWILVLIIVVVLGIILIALFKYRRSALGANDTFIPDLNHHYYTIVHAGLKHLWASYQITKIRT